LKVLKFLDKHFEEMFVVVLFAWVILLISIQIITRYFLTSINLPWTEEIARYSYIYMVFIGVSYGTRMDSHLKVDILKGALSIKGQKVQRILTEIVCTVFFIYLTPFALKIVQAQIKSAKLLPVARIPMFYFGTAIIVLTVLLTLRSAQAIILELIALNKMKKEARPE